jgi:hypothetical protein
VFATDRSRYGRGLAERPLVTWGAMAVEIAGKSPPTYHLWILREDVPATVTNSGALTAATIPEASIIGLASAEISFP